MDRERRTFLKIAGASLCGLGMKSLLSVKCQAKEPGVIRDATALTGKRWALVISMERCKEGCTDCIAACHRSHNVPDLGSPKDEIKWIWREPYGNAFLREEHQYGKEYVDQNLRGKSFIVLCNHCDNPPCVRVCPTKATWKREDGIVMMDYHRCIGCRYCMAACPYGARSMNWKDPRPFLKEVERDYPTRTQGVVEKCNFCEERLARGRVPACVEACTEKALTFGNAEDPGSPVRMLLRSQYSIRRKPHLGTIPQVYYLV